MATPLYSKEMSIVLDSSTLACAQSFTLSVNKDVIEISCLGDTGFKSSVPDMIGWSVSFDAMVQKTSTLSNQASFESLMYNLLSTDASVGVYILPDVSANAYWKGAGFLTSLEMTGGVGSPVSFSGEITGSGTLARYTTN